MTSSEYQTEFNQQVANGLYPICIQGGGSTNAPVYAAIFAKQDIRPLVNGPRREQRSPRLPGSIRRWRPSCGPTASVPHNSQLPRTE
jgi:hypothetical protein